MCLLLLISSAVFVPAYASEIGNPVTTPISVYNLNEYSGAWFQGATASPSSAVGGILIPAVSTSTIGTSSPGSVKTTTKVTDVSSTVSFNGYAQPKWKYLSSSSYSPVFRIYISVPRNASLSGGYFVSGDIYITVNCVLTLSTGESVTCYPVSCSIGETVVSASGSHMRFHYEYYSPTGLPNDITITVNIGSSAFVKSSFTGSATSSLKLGVNSGNFQVTQYPSGWLQSTGYLRVTPFTSSSPEWGSLQTTPSTSPVAGSGGDGGSSVDLTETNSKIDAVGEKVDGVKDAVSDVEQVIKDGNEQASTERQGILQAILNLPQTILDGVVHLFVPTEEDIQEVKESYDEMLQDKLGLGYQAIELIDTLVSSVHENLSSSTPYEFTFPGISFPFNGKILTILPETPVSLDNAFMDVVRPVAGTAVIFISILSFVNMCKNFLESLLSGKGISDFDGSK